MFRQRFLAPETSGAALALGSAWSTWLVWMFSFHARPTHDRSDALAADIELKQYYKAITVRPGSPLDPPRAAPIRRAWANLVPSAVCVGPLRGLATQGKDDRRKSKAVRDITAAQERRWAESAGSHPTPSASGHTGAQNPEGRGARAQRNERVCRKCVEGPTGPPVKPGESRDPGATPN